MAVVAELLQIAWLAMLFNVVVGFTVMVKVVEFPPQLTAPLVQEADTVMVEIIGVVAALVAVNEGIFPVPLEARLIEGALLVQL